MSSHRVIFVALATLFTVGMTSLASAGCCGWGYSAPVVYGGYGGGYGGGCCATPTAAVVFAQPVAPAPTRTPSTGIATRADRMSPSPRRRLAGGLGMSKPAPRVGCLSAISKGSTSSVDKPLGPLDPGTRSGARAPGRLRFPWLAGRGGRSGSRVTRRPSGPDDARMCRMRNGRRARTWLR